MLRRHARREVHRRRLHGPQSHDANHGHRGRCGRPGRHAKPPPAARREQTPPAGRTGGRRGGGRAAGGADTRHLHPCHRWRRQQRLPAAFGCANFGRHTSLPPTHHLRHRLLNRNRHLEAPSSPTGSPWQRLPWPSLSLRPWRSRSPEQRAGSSTPPPHYQPPPPSPPLPRPTPWWPPSCWPLTWRWSVVLAHPVRAGPPPPPPIHPTCTASDGGGRRTRGTAPRRPRPDAAVTSSATLHW